MREVMVTDRQMTTMNGAVMAEIHYPCRGWVYADKLTMEKPLGIPD